MKWTIGSQRLVDHKWAIGGYTRTWDPRTKINWSGIKWTRTEQNDKFRTGSGLRKFLRTDQFANIFHSRNKNPRIFKKKSDIFTYNPCGPWIPI